LLLAKKELDKRPGLTVKKFHEALKQSIFALGIEHIHYPGDGNYNGNSRRHLKLDWSTEIETQRQINNPIYLSEKDLKKLAQNDYRQWFDYDVKVLVNGANSHKDGSVIDFDAIALDTSLKFIVRREKKPLQTKWNSLVRNGTVYQDSNGTWIFPELSSSSNKNVYRLPESFTLAAATVSTPVQRPQVQIQGDPFQSIDSPLLSSSRSASSSSSRELDLSDIDSEIAAANNEYDNFPQGKFANTS